MRSEAELKKKHNSRSRQRKLTVTAQNLINKTSL